ncbi:MAG: hypothetical protein NTW19_08335 [Planctomycetota bacterium]|nr:hypothetical protein [Planctomycetota bacterium]
MKHQIIEILLNSPVESLVWNEGYLMDWVGGNRKIQLDGKDSGPRVIWAYRFDAAIQSPSGRYAAVYERLGTKAVLLDNGEHLRELNRSFYHANVYEYPIAFIQLPDGRELIAHCPEEYNRIEIDDVETGKRLTPKSDRKPDDFFHSRLSVSHDGRRLLSAGWVWHPFNSVATWLIQEALADSRVLDKACSPHGAGAEINCASFLDSDRNLMNSSIDADDFSDDEDTLFHKGSLAVFDLRSNTIESVAKTDQTLGTMLWLGDDRIASFYGFAKIIDLKTGKATFNWPDIMTGKQDSSIIHYLDSLPPIAMDSSGKRFAVASKDRITVVQC